MNQTKLLKVINISKSFGGVQAVRNVSFDIKPGELLGVIGPNGSGKTTIVNLITRFVKATSGEVMFHGEKINHLPPHKIIRLGISRTFQMVRPFYKLPAYKNMIIPLYSPRVKNFVGGKYGDR
ncbi:MAG: ATP-binding cassette domain-containing protein, partial [Desulfobacula sp.]|nr:ATP-binding cassette domain-containing protein [Desulfobacula sp.]